jgi:membrane protease YdiL (CAAX protease family)
LQDSPITFPREGFWWLWTILFLIGIAVIVVVVSTIAAITWMLTQHLSFQELARAASTGFPAIILTGIPEILALIFIFLLLPVVAKTSFYGLGFRPLTSTQWAAIAIGAIAMFVIVTPLASALENALHFKSPEAAIAAFTNTTGWQKIVFAIFGIVLAPLFEEAVFRWTLFNALRKWWGLWPGAIISSALFGLAHAQAPFTPAMVACICLPLAVGGLILCMVYARTNNAWASVLTHGTFNALSLILLLLFPQLAK